jgi:hypothetical protein
MIDAKTCREQSDKNKVNLMRKGIEQKIRNAVVKGRTKLNFTGGLPEELLQELNEAGFKVGNGIIEW